MSHWQTFPAARQLGTSFLCYSILLMGSQFVLSWHTPWWGLQEPRFFPLIECFHPSSKSPGFLTWHLGLWWLPHYCPLNISSFIWILLSYRMLGFVLCARDNNSEQDPNSALTSFTDNSKDNYKKRERERDNYNKVSYVLWEIQGVPESLNADWNGMLMEDFPEGAASKRRSGQPAGVS